MTTTGEVRQALIPEWTFGDRLKKARAISGTDVEVIAKRAGRSARAVHSWEQAARQPRDVFGIVRVYAEVTGVPEHWLLTGESREPDLFRNRCFPSSIQRVA